MGSSASSSRTRPLSPQRASNPKTEPPSSQRTGGPQPKPLPPQPTSGTDPPSSRRTSSPQAQAVLPQPASGSQTPSPGNAANGGGNAPADVPAAAVEPKTPEDDSSSKESGKIVSQCIEFLKNATNTGGKTVRRSPSDTHAALQQNSGKRQDLRPKFIKSLEQLHAADDYADDSAMESLLTICKMSDLTDTGIADELVEMRYPELFVKIWQGVYRDDIYTSKELYRHYVVFNLLKQATISFTHVSYKLCTEMGSEGSGIVLLIAKEFEHPLMTLTALKDGVKKALWDSPRETLKKMVNILANIIRGNIDSKPVFRQAKIVPHLQALLECRFLIMRAKALFTLVYLINEDENEALNTTDDNIKFVIKVLDKCLGEKDHYSEHYTFSAEVVVDGIVCLADNDSNKVKLVKNGVMPKLITMLKTDSVAEKRTAARAVWKLAFHEDNKKQFKTNQELITVLKELHSKETEQKLLQACETVLWMLDVCTEDGKGTRPSTGKRPKTAQRTKSSRSTDKEKSETTPGEAENDDDDEIQSSDDYDLEEDLPHVMISYQWGVQTQVIKVKELLRAAGYNVWMDVDNMGGSTLESMASAVEQSAVVLVCFTEKYKRSASCRTEAEYTYKLQKPIIPLRLQEDYDPDGWLGIMIGTKLYFDLSRADAFHENVEKLKQQLGDRGRVPKEGTGTLKSTLASGQNQQHDPLKASGTQANTQRGPSTRRSNNAKQSGAQDLIDAKTVSSWNNDQVNTWLARHGLGSLKNRFDGYSGQRLLGLKTVAAKAPDFFYAELKKDLGFKNLLEIVTFQQALDEII